MSTPLRYASYFLLCSISLTGYSQPIQTIPFRLVGKLIVLTATVDGQPGNFILDTGVTHLTLNSHYFPGETTGKDMHGIFGTASQLQMRYSHFRCGELDLDEVYSQTLSLQHIERAKGIIIHGLIGTELLREYEVHIDLQSQVLSFAPGDRQNSASYRYLVPPIDTIEFRWKGNLPSLTAKAGHRRLNLLLDTGAEIGLLNDNQPRRLSADYLVPQTRGKTKVVSFSPTKEHLPVSLLSQLSLGRRGCPPLRVVLGSMRAFNDNLPGPFLDGLIGYEILHADCFAINFSEQAIYIWQSGDSHYSPLLARKG